MGTYTIDRDGNIVYDNNTILYLQEEEEKKEEKVFGRDIFNTKNLTFEPSVNLATPVDYHLGPGDEVIIDIWEPIRLPYAIIFLLMDTLI